VAPAAPCADAQGRRAARAGGAGGKAGGDKGRLQTALLSLGAWHTQLGHVQVRGPGGAGGAGASLARGAGKVARRHSYPWNVRSDCRSVRTCKALGRLFRLLLEQTRLAQSELGMTADERLRPEVHLGQKGLDGMPARGERARARAQGAAMALNEAVRVAQQHGDHAALTHVLAALLRLLAAAAPPPPAAPGEACGAGGPPGHLLHTLRLIRRCARTCRV